MMSPIESLSVKIFADGANREAIVALARNPLIKGFTTNPTLMRQAGVADYEEFAREVLDVVNDRPFSLEVFSDDFDEMAEQARRIAKWGENVYVKIPVTNTHGEASVALIRDLVAEGIKLNVTALMTTRQVRTVADALADAASSFVSVFAGRIADAGVDPIPLMAASVEILSAFPGLELIWASPREVLNILQADAVGCHVITVTHELLGKIGGIGRDLDDFSLATVRMFRDDAVAAGYHIA
jgi:transaldolase